MKIIDLLNKMAKGEELPKKIRYNFKTYFYNNFTQDYGLFNDYLENNYGLSNCLNDEVEILEEKKIPEKINNSYYHLSQDQQNQLFKNTINEIIDYLKSKGE